MDAVTERPHTPHLELLSNLSPSARQVLALRDIGDGLRLWRLALTLAWLDIKLRYRGSVLGPFWLTLSTGVMVGALGFVYSTLFRQNLHAYLPFLALSLVLWGALSSQVAEACTCFTQAEGTIRSLRIPFFLQAARVLVRNVLTLAHNVVVIVAVYALFDAWPGEDALAAVPAMLLWVVDGIAAALLLGAFCARFRDIPPIVGNVMQIAFYISAVIWKPDQLGNPTWLLFNPFFTLLEILRGPLLGYVPAPSVWASALGCSVVLCIAAWMLFARVRGRIAFWV